MFTHNFSFVMAPLGRAFVLLLVMFASTQACAQVYGGAAYGITEPNSQGETSTLPALDGDAGYRVFLGNRVSEKFAVEFSYVSLGEYAVGPLEGEAVDPDELQDTITLTAADVSFIARFPVLRYVSLYAKVGAHYWRGERFIDVNDTTNNRRLRTLLTYDDVDLSAGLGADYRFSPRLGVTLEVNGYKTVDVYNLMTGIGLYATF